MSEPKPPSCGDSKTPCGDAMTRLWEYIDGELTPETMNRIQDHLDRCQRCFPHYDFQRAFVTFMRKQSSAPTPPGLRRRIFELLLEEERHSTTR